jgi:hypothetical protein
VAGPVSIQPCRRSRWFTGARQDKELSWQKLRSGIIRRSWFGRKIETPLVASIVMTQADPERDFVRLGHDFYIVFLYGDVTDESEFLRSARSVWLEIKSDNEEETRRHIVDSGLVRRLDIPDPHLYFQAPGGQCMRLVGIDEDLSFYEGTGPGPDVARVKEAISAHGSGQAGPAPN